MKTLTRKSPEVTASRYVRRRYAGALERQRDEALDRLIVLLEGQRPAAERPIAPSHEDATEPQHHLARLREAHVSYALASGVMRRVGVGAWIRRSEE